MKLLKYSGGNVGLLGLGRTCMMCFHALQGASVFAYDDNVEKLREFIEKYNASPIDQIGKLDCLITSPSLFNHPLATLAREHGVRVTSDIELFFEQNRNKTYIAITGTNGKSTTTALTTHILRTLGKDFVMGGNIGIPCFSLPLTREGYVFELSSFQLELINNFRPHISALLNITPDHITQHLSFNNYVNAKKRMFKNQNMCDNAVINIDHEITRDIVEELRRRTTITTIGANSRNANVLVAQNRVNAWQNSLALEHNDHFDYTHNGENIAAAIAIAHALKCDIKDILNSIASFNGLPHRMEFVGKKVNVNFYNDSKATNAHATYKALMALSNIYWIAGGRPKEEGIEPLIHIMHRVKTAYFYGEAAQEFYTSASTSTKCFVFQDMKTAVEAAFHDALSIHTNANILLSPACASFDQFKDFEDRGEYFKTIVQQLSSH